MPCRHHRICVVSARKWACFSFPLTAEEVKVMNTSAEEHDSQQAQTNLSWLDLEVPSRSALPPWQVFAFTAKLQPWSSALPTSIYEQTGELCQFGECGCPLILTPSQKAIAREFRGDDIIWQSENGLFFFYWYGSNAISCRFVTLLTSFKLCHRATSVSY